MIIKDLIEFNIQVADKVMRTVEAIGNEVASKLNIAENMMEDYLESEKEHPTTPFTFTVGEMLDQIRNHIDYHVTLELWIDTESTDNLYHVEYEIYELKTGRFLANFTTDGTDLHEILSEAIRDLNREYTTDSSEDEVVEASACPNCGHYPFL